MKVKEFMKKDLVTVDASTPIMDALDTMKKNGIKRLPVMKKGKFTGLVTRSMLRDASPSEATSLSIYELNYIISKMTVQDIMIKNPITISPDMPVEEAIWLGKEKGIGAFPVTEKKELVGIITESDISGVVSRALGLGEKESKRISIEPSGEQYGFLKEIVQVFDDLKIPILSLMTIVKPDLHDWSLVIRIKAKKANIAVENLRKKGFNVTDVS